MLRFLEALSSNDRYEMYLNKGADFILLGEAEMTLLELVNALEKKEQDLFNIEGLAFKQNNAAINDAIIFIVIYLQ